MSHFNVRLTFPVDTPDLSASLIKHLEKQCYYLGDTQFSESINALITEWAQDHGFETIATPNGIELVHDKL